MKYSESAITESFYLSYMSAQVPGFNRVLVKKFKTKKEIGL